MTTIVLSTNRPGPIDERAALNAYQRARRYVLAGMIFTLGFLFVFIGSSQSELMHERLEGVGMVLLLIGIGGRLWSTLYIGGRKSLEVVDTGPYSITRNPLYFFSAIAAAGVGAQIGSWVTSAVFAVLCWAAFMVVVRREEKFLTKELGDPYLSYLGRVPRFFPNPLLYRDSREVTFKPRLFNQTLVDGLVFVLAVPVFELIEYGQETGFIPVLVLLP